MLLVEERTVKKYRYDEQGNVSVLQEDIKQYYYKDEEERNKHANLMQSKGYKDSGQVRENTGTVMKPSYVWFASYYKTKVTEQQKDKSRNQ